MSLPERFQRHKFLTAAEIDDLARHLSAARRGEQGDTIGRTKSSVYIGYAAKYLRWLADETINESNIHWVREAIAGQNERLMAKTIRKRGSKSAQAQLLITKRLSDTARDQLLGLFANPFQLVSRASDRGPRFRNVVMLRILYETGMRRGELLSQKLRNVCESSGNGYAALQIERNHHDEFDSRVSQPVAKTQGRTLPISSDAERQLLEYIGAYRAEVPGVNFSDQGFIFVNHRAGRSQGKPLTESALHAALKNLRQAFPGLQGIHPHLLRHDWNYRFSQRAKQEAMPHDKEREIREMLMGWTHNSEMSAVYNRRHVEEEAALLGLAIASSTQRKQ